MQPSSRSAAPLLHQVDDSGAPRAASGVLARLAVSCQAEVRKVGNDEHAPPSFSATCGRLCHCCPDNGLHTSSNENCASAAGRIETRRSYRSTAKAPATFAGINSAGAARSGRSFRLEPRTLSLELHGSDKRTGHRLHLVTRSLRRTTLSNVSVDQRKLDAARRLVGMDAGELAITVVMGTRSVAGRVARSRTPWRCRSPRPMMRLLCDRR